MELCLWGRGRIHVLSKGMTGGGKPRSARCRTNSRKVKQSQLKSKRNTHVRSEETIGSTTEDVLRQSRTNPKANVKLSGKKKRLLVKEAKRLMKEKKEMEVTSETNGADTNLELQEDHEQTSTMDTS